MNGMCSAYKMNETQQEDKMKKSTMLICAFMALLTLAGCSSISNDSTSGNTMPVITIYNKDYIASDMVVSELPTGYEYIGDLPDDAANDTGLAGCKMYAIKELNSLSDFYLYQETESITNESATSTEQPQWNYVRWVLHE